MSSEWRDLPTMQDVARAQIEKWEIEEFYMGDWILWMQRGWTFGTRYRGRPAQPKKTIVISECWRHPEHGGLFWRSHGNTTCKPEAYVRFPAGDITGYVEQ